MTEVDQKEKKRLQLLETFEVMDSKEEAGFDNLVQLAAYICDVPFAKINFLDDKRSWSKANYGNDIKETPREAAFCHYTIQDDSHMIIEDTLEDERFKEAPFVIESPNVRFYAGFNIQVSGHNLGTICVLGQEPKKLKESQIKALSTIASEIQARLELRKKNKDLATLSAFLEASVEAMLIVNPKDLSIIRMNTNGKNLLGRLIPKRSEKPLPELFPEWEYLDRLKEWQKSSTKKPFTMETMLEDLHGKKVFLQVNTTRKYGKLLITFQNLTKRRLAEESLSEEKKLSDAIINALPSHFYMFDENFNFIRWNKNINETTGYSDAELSKMKPHEFFEGEDVQRVQDYVERTMNGYKGAIQADLVAKNESSIPFLFHAIAFDYKGQTYFLGTGQSVAEQVEYESNLENLLHEKEVLLQEVHHRVKNNLAVISGVLQLQEFITEDEHTKSILSSNYMRIKSMALIHEELYKAHDFSGMDFEHYLVNLMKSVESRFTVPGKEIALHIDSESIYMNLNQAVPLSLIINELVSNAYNFAFKGRETGNIWVRLKRKKNSIYVSVQDDGIGLPEDFTFEESPTLGTTLVMSYSDQLNADVQISSENGTHYQLTFENNQSSVGSSLHTKV